MSSVNPVHVALRVACTATVTPPIANPPAVISIVVETSPEAGAFVAVSVAVASISVARYAEYAPETIAVLNVMTMSPVVPVGTAAMKIPATVEFVGLLLV